MSVRGIYKAQQRINLVSFKQPNKGRSSLKYKMTNNLNHSYLIALGGNLPSVAGDPSDTLSAALLALSEAGATQIVSSRFFKTPCFPEGAGPDYVNAAVSLCFAGGAVKLLRVLHEIEGKFGRERVERWGRRTLDLDMIAAGNQVLPDAETHARWRALPAAQQALRAPDQLILPHPRLQDRAFVLIPLAEVAPDWFHPLLGLTVTQMVQNLSESARNEVVCL